ncbi:argonaute 1, partial [Chytridiales sp. JEL 0842]
MAMTLPNRPGYGTSGTKVLVKSNYYPINRLPQGAVYHYELAFDPYATILIRFQLFATLAQAECRPGGLFEDIKPVYDGGKILFSIKPIGGLTDVGQFKQFSVHLPPESSSGSAGTRPAAAPGTGGSGGSGSGQSGSRRSTGSEFSATLTLRSVVHMSTLQNYLAGTQKDVPQDAINVLNLVVAQRGNLLFTPAMRGIYSDEFRRGLTGGLEAWKGFKLSVRPTRNRALLNINSTASAFFKSGPVIEVIAEILKIPVAQLANLQWTARHRQTITAAFKSVKVQVNYRGQMKRSYRFIKVMDTTAASTTFQMERDGNVEEISVEKYIQQTYNIRLQYPNAPIFWVGPRSKNTYVPFELLYLPPRQSCTRKLNPDQTANMITFTAEKPAVKLAGIEKGLKDLVGTEEMGGQGEVVNEYLEEFGMSIGGESLGVTGRFLPHPNVLYNTKSPQPKLKPDEVKSGSWNLMHRQMVQGATLKSWAIVNFAAQMTRPDDVKNFVEVFVKTSKASGVNVEFNRPPIHTCDPQAPLTTIETKLRGAGTEVYRATNVIPQLIVCILPTKDANLYQCIKLAADTLVGVPTQCVQSAHVKKASVAYVANVMAKVNMKLDGVNHTLDRKDLGFIAKKPTMMVGADISHPGPGQSFKPSVSAVVGSMDAFCTKFISRFAIQRQREVMGEGEDQRRRGPQDSIELFGNLLFQLLESFQKKNGCNPERIIIFRDGVSEGQFQSVIGTELRAIREACVMINLQYKPTLTFIVVQKRHQTRFFPANSTQADRSGNIRPGLVVD